MPYFFSWELPTTKFSLQEEIKEEEEAIIKRIIEENIDIKYDSV